MSFVFTIRQLTAAFAIIAPVALASATVMAADTFRSEELKFQIDFPVAPERAERVQNVQSGPARVVRFKSKGPAIRPSLSVIVFSRTAFSAEEVRAGIEMSSQQQLAGLKGTLVSQRALERNGFAGKETIIEARWQDRPFFYRAQVYYAGNRQYLLSVAGGTIESVGVPADRYFSSFKLWD